MRVAVWLHVDGSTVRGSWDLPPWHGELAGRWRDDAFVGAWRQEGVIAIQQRRERAVRLVRGGDGTLREEGAADGEAIELRRAGRARTAPSPGLWLGRWTGLPPGVAVETQLTAPADGTFRATYRYQLREGSFDGEALAGGGMSIRWREVSARDGVARGAGRLLPDVLGLRGGYGVDDREDGTGIWTLEALDVR